MTPGLSYGKMPTSMEAEWHRLGCSGFFPLEHKEVVREKCPQNTSE
jgi:hypothetical protein